MLYKMGLVNVDSCTCTIICKQREDWTHLLAGSLSYARGFQPQASLTACTSERINTICIYVTHSCSCSLSYFIWKTGRIMIRKLMVRHNFRQQLSVNCVCTAICMYFTNFQCNGSIMYSRESRGILAYEFVS